LGLKRIKSLPIHLREDLSLSKINGPMNPGFSRKKS